MRFTLDDVKAYVAAYVNAAKQAGEWPTNKEDITDKITGLIEKVSEQFHIGYSFGDKFTEIDAQGRPGIWEEFFTSLVPVMGVDRDESTAGSDENSASFPVFDTPSYNFVLRDPVTGEADLKFKTTVSQKLFDRYMLSGNDNDLAVYIVSQLYNSYYNFKYNAKLRLLQNMISKAITNQTGEIAYVQNSTVIKAGHIYSESSKYYIAKKNYNAKVNKTLATLAGETPATVIEITPKLVDATIAKPEDTATCEAAILAINNVIEELTIDATEGTSLAGTAIAANKEDLVLFLVPGVENTIKATCLSGAFHKEDLSLDVKVKTLPATFVPAGSNAWGFLVDLRGIKMVEEDMDVVSNDVKGDRFTNYWLHTQLTGVISNHVACRVFTAA